ncbi:MULTISPECIES: hypothetical protein [Limosilactobacillus]|uniref:hypothetical protein n=1 Tax=Limosilactobacillus TaxID=2742598 RepID=UPI0015FD35BB|nr:MULTISPECIES: hypothetical protein [Limosilactobacillus]MBB1109466.1 hypothetical protein [Limosilactobacillus balticus]MCC4467540.1 hypothetical protein [Limosilactobacillus reuteri]MCC4472636.1 hypothetical protein [Limosilactobacillus reuteri]
MKMKEAEWALKNNTLVLYQDTLCSVVSVDYDHNRVMISEEEREKFGEFVSRYVDPEQLDQVTGCNYD